MGKRCFAAGIVLAMLPSGFASGAEAAQLHVPLEYPTIQAAVDAAAPGDSVMVSPGIYAAPPDSTRILRCIGKAIYVIGTAGSDSTILYGAGGGGLSLIDVPPPGLSLQGLTIEECAGGIYCSGSDLLCSEIQWRGNCSDLYAGGLTLINSVARITGSGFADNRSGWDTISGGFGGALYLWGESSAYLSEVEFLRNEASFGGGAIAMLHADSLTLDRVSFEDNSGHSGGALYVEASSAEDSSSVRIQESVFHSNSAVGDGGAIRAAGGRLELEAVVISGNEAGQYGGGIDCSRTALRIASCTIARNQSTVGGAAIHVDDGGEAGSVSLEVCIVALNTGSSSLEWAGDGAAPVLACCDVFATNGDHFGGAWPDVIGQDGNFSAYPYFCGTGPYDEQSGADFSYELQTNSPCLPGGNPCGILVGAFGEGCIASVAGDSDSADWQPARALPNPFVETTRIRGALPGAGPAMLCIYDIRGRKLRELKALAGANESAVEFAWDGRDGEGRPAPCGVYLYRIEREGRRLSGRVTRLR